VSSTYFISDLHLDASRPQVTDGLASFLRKIAGCDALYILGDLFESWVGDDDDAPLAGIAADHLRTFSISGSKLFLLHGNRDFLIRSAFAARAGMVLLPDPTTIDLYGTQTLILHGDSLCTSDSQYQAFRAQVRSPDWQAEQLARPLEERRRVARQLRTLSHDAKSNKPADITDVDPATVEKTARAHGVTRIIHGHTHRPARHETAFGERWVLGDWNSKGWCLRATSSGLTQECFLLNQ